MSKVVLLFFSALLLAAGCATNTVESRRKERYSSYSALPPDLRAVVDQGQIKVGMPMDGVYIAWGPPGQILNGESSQGSLTTWLYFGTTWEEYRYWNYRPSFSRHRYSYEPYMDFDYQPRSYVSAEVIFENGLVKSWRSLQRPY